MFRPLKIWLLTDEENRTCISSETLSNEKRESRSDSVESDEFIAHGYKIFKINLLSVIFIWMIFCIRHLDVFIPKEVSNGSIIPDSLGYTLEAMDLFEFNASEQVIYGITYKLGNVVF